MIISKRLFKITDYKESNMLYDKQALYERYYAVNAEMSDEFNQIHNFIRKLGYNSLYDIWNIDKDDYTYDVILARANRGLKGITDKNSDKLRLYTYCQSVFSI